ncbi:MAG: SsrA-binding protein SmpB [Candidatus Omnitrophica bacterium]|nr:SsrA-binding protein SmpB [Candidatus Omnitrophota bacterium]
MTERGVVCYSLTVKEKTPQNKVIVTNREAGRDYFILEALEAGIVLSGCEVKSLRGGKASLSGSFARLEGGAVILYNLYVDPYEKGGRENAEPRRERKLLLHGSQIERLKSQTAEKGRALIPLSLYFKHGLVKVELAVAKGKKKYDKRADIKKREVQREIDRAVKNRGRR